MFTQDWYNCIAQNLNGNWYNYMPKVNNEEDKMKEKIKETVKKIREMPLKDLSELTPEELGKVKFFYQEVNDGWAGGTFWRVLAVYDDHRVFDDNFCRKPELSDVTRRLREVYDIRTQANNNNQRVF